LDKLIEFESLAAKRKLDKEDDFYLEVFDTAIKDRDNKNIAISGGYGAGKTTIIDTYFNKYEKKDARMFKVSIATFENGESTTSNNQLEKQILQQLFYQVNPSKIPNSRFTKISDLPKLLVVKIVLYILLATVLTITLLQMDWLYQFTWYNENEWIFTVDDFKRIIAWIAIGVLNSISIILILNSIQKLGVTRFGVANTNIEFNFQNEDSVFHHYYDEIIYLFRKTDLQYIVFEDLDRFDNITIFERLRSLNTSLNSSAQLKDRKIKFIYALRDDVFSIDNNSDSINNRTKFFDFIIPTLKVVHSSNAESHLRKKLDNLLSEEDEQINDKDNQKISLRLIEDISLFINDMRTLKNICNEFEVFRFKLKEASIVYNNLFAFIVYKNMYPKDYSELIENKGMVYDVFHEKEKMIEQLENKMESLQKKSIDGLGSIITSKDDVAILFAKKAVIKGKSIRQNEINLCSDNNRNSTYKERGEKFLDTLIKKEVSGAISLHNISGKLKEYDSVDDFVTINSVNYLELYRDFDKVHEEEAFKLESEINELKDKIHYVKTKSISRLIIEDEIELHVNLADKRLLYFLIRHNWLNESYEDYLTVFREGALSQKDKEFIQQVKLGMPNSNLHIEFSDVEKVINKIRVDDISSRAIMSTDIIAYLLKYQVDDNLEKINKIIQIIFTNMDENFQEYFTLLDELERVSSANNNLVWKLYMVL